MLACYRTERPSLLFVSRCFFVEHKEISVDEFKRVAEDESKSAPAMQRKVRMAGWVRI